MKTVDEWFRLYGESHQNPTNKLIHWICIPLIMFSLLGLLKAIPVPEIFPASFDFSWILIIGALIFYLMLSWQLSIGMVIVVGLMLLGLRALASTGANLAITNLAIFFIAWVFNLSVIKLKERSLLFLPTFSFF
jgi:uncharacterized membrane protein YGL010W